MFVVKCLFFMKLLLYKASIQYLTVERIFSPPPHPDQPWDPPGLLFIEYQWLFPWG